MDCYFRQSWQDRRLSFSGPIETLSLSIKMLEGIWKPDTFIYNGKVNTRMRWLILLINKHFHFIQKSYIHTITQPNKLLRIKRDGSILYSVRSVSINRNGVKFVWNLNDFKIRLTIKAKCPMELREFPMDKQSCPLVLGSCNDIQAILWPCVAQLINNEWMNENTRRWIHSRRAGVHVGRESRRPVPHRSRIVAVRPHFQSLSQRDHFQETRRLFRPSSQFQFAP